MLPTGAVPSNDEQLSALKERLTFTLPPTRISEDLSFLYYRPSNRLLIITVAVWEVHSFFLNTMGINPFIIGSSNVDDVKQGVFMSGASSSSFGLDVVIAVPSTYVVAMMRVLGATVYSYRVGGDNDGVDFCVDDLDVLRRFGPNVPSVTQFRCFDHPTMSGYVGLYPVYVGYDRLLQFVTQKFEARGHTVQWYLFPAAVDHVRSIVATEREMRTPPTSVYVYLINELLVRLQYSVYGEWLGVSPDVSFSFPRLNDLTNCFYAVVTPPFGDEGVQHWLSTQTNVVRTVSFTVGRQLRFTDEDIYASRQVILESYGGYRVEEIPSITGLLPYGGRLLPVAISGHVHNMCVVSTFIPVDFYRLYHQTLWNVKMSRRASMRPMEKKLVRLGLLSERSNASTVGRLWHNKPEILLGIISARLTSDFLGRQNDFSPVMELFRGMPEIITQSWVVRNSLSKVDGFRPESVVPRFTHVFGANSNAAVNVELRRISNEVKRIMIESLYYRAPVEKSVVVSPLCFIAAHAGAGKTTFARDNDDVLDIDDVFSDSAVDGAKELKDRVVAENTEAGWAEWNSFRDGHIRERLGSHLAGKRVILCHHPDDVSRWFGPGAVAHAVVQIDEDEFIRRQRTFVPRRAAVSRINYDSLTGLATHSSIDDAYRDLFAVDRVDTSAATLPRFPAVRDACFGPVPDRSAVLKMSAVLGDGRYDRVLMYGEAPGHFAHHLIESKRADLVYGYTRPSTLQSEQWRSDLLSNPRFHVLDSILSPPRELDLITSDAGFSPDSFENIEAEWLILVQQVVELLPSLRDGGSLLIKTSSCTDVPTRELLSYIGVHFSSVLLVKPSASKIVGRERYWLFRGYGQLGASGVFMDTAIQEFGLRQQRALDHVAFWHDSSVLDLCGGRGGDMSKFLPATQDYTLVDGSHNAVMEAIRRRSRDGMFHRFIPVVADCLTFLPSFSGATVINFQFAIQFFDQARIYSALNDATFNILIISYIPKTTTSVLVTKQNAPFNLQFSRNDSVTYKFSLPGSIEPTIEYYVDEGLMLRSIVSDRVVVSPFRDVYFSKGGAGAEGHPWSTAVFYRGYDPLV
jgi:hypothetical protein